MALPVGLTIDVAGDEALSKKIGGILDRLRRPLPAYVATANLLEKHVRAVFQTQGKRLGRGWKKLAPSTVKARTKRWGYYRRKAPSFGASGASPILTWSGNLRLSFARGGAGHIRQVSQSGLIWGSSVRYGRFHDSPGPRAGRLPRRAILDFVTQFQKREILVRPLQLWIQGVPPGSIETVVGARIGVGP